MIAILLHSISLLGIVYFDHSLFTKAMPYILLLMLVLIVYTQGKPTGGFVIFFVACYIIGMAADIAGVADSSLFGEFHYGTVLGPTFKKVPFLIGVNWFLIIYCCGITVNTVLQKLSARVTEMTGKVLPAIKRISLVTDAAMLAVFFSWVMESAEIKLGYWSWTDSGDAPLYNYACWLVISAVLMTIFSFLHFEKRNRFALNLLLIQMMFYLLLRTFL